jgi:hypothetical protein
MQQDALISLGDRQDVTDLLRINPLHVPELLVAGEQPLHDQATGGGDSHHHRLWSEASSRAARPIASSAGPRLVSVA